MSESSLHALNVRQHAVLLEVTAGACREFFWPAIPDYCKVLLIHMVDVLRPMQVAIHIARIAT